MMARYKQLIFSLIIIIIVIVLDIIFEKITIKDLDEINEMLGTLDKKVVEVDKISENENYKNQDELEEESQKIVDKWEKIHKVLACYIEHDEIEKVADKLKLIQKQIKIQEFGDAGQAITEAEFLLEHLKEKQKVSLENIF
jgi:hypothetical protein